jgi:hypothetical protein
MPKTYSEAERARIAEYVLDELAKGHSLTTICNGIFKAIGVGVSYSQWMRWQLADEVLRERVAHAREAGATKLLEEVIEIADDKSEDSNSRRVRIYAREKYAAMIAPQRFGQQKLDITSGGKALPQPIQASTDRIDALLAIAAMRMGNGQRQLEAPIIEGEIVDIDDVMS